MNNPELDGLLKEMEGRRKCRSCDETASSELLILSTDSDEGSKVEFICRSCLKGGKDAPGT